MSDFDALSANEPELVKLRTAIREFLTADRNDFGWEPMVDSWLSCWDEGFSARLGDAGFIGLTIPKEYGGHGLDHLHRYVVSEELLVAGAPVAAHWTADRQVAPGLLTYGNEEQRRRLLPRIVAGKLYSAIGMSEDAAGSDLAAAQTRASEADGGWVLNGKKVWTSGAHHAHQIVVFARTSPPDPENRHAGFSQFIVQADSPGVSVSPIILMSGEHHFNEVQFDDVFIPDSDVLGEIGNGWRQVTSELSFECSGPDRILTTAPLIMALVRALGAQDVDERTAADLGDLIARLASLRQLSVSVAQAHSAGRDAANEAALVKDLGTCFEQESVELVSNLVAAVDAGSPATPLLRNLITHARLHAPLFTLRGGTNEVLRGVVARGMGLR